MPRYAVTFTAAVNTVVEVDAPDGATPDQVAALAAVQNEEPDLCNQCARGQFGHQPLELGDDWRVATFRGAPAVTRLA